MLHLQEGEHIEIKARKHWYSLFRNSVGLLILLLLPFVFWSLFSEQIEFTLDKLSIAVNPLFLEFLITMWFLFIWVRFFVAWTHYFLDVWIVTDRRIIDIDQKSLFVREVSTLRIEKIQDVTMEIKGIVATVLDFGDITVQTAAEKREFLMKDIARPGHVKSRILAHLDKRM